MGKREPLLLDSVIASTGTIPGALGADSEYVYYTVRGRRKRRGGATNPSVFRRLQVWYGTIPGPGEDGDDGAAETAPLPEWAQAAHDDDVGDTVPLPRVPRPR